MSKKIYGVTVGTPMSPATIEEKLKPVKTVNGVAPDENGNVNVEGGSGAATVTVFGIGPGLSESGADVPGSADHTAAQIKALADSGTVPILYCDAVYYEYSHSSTAALASFYRIEILKNYIKKHYCYIDASGVLTQHTVRYDPKTDDVTDEHINSLIDAKNLVQTVNGVAPDANGNVVVQGGGGSGGAGIHVGDTAPSDTSMLWVDTSDNEGSTVDSVNGKTGTVVLTAEDVGAMPAGTSVDYTLPVATAETLGGIKVGEGLSVDASGVLSVSGGGSSGGGGVPTWSLLGEYDMSTIADSANISLTGLDNLTHLYFKWEALQNETSTDSSYYLSINGKQHAACIASKKSGSSVYGYTICKWNGLVWEIQMSGGAIAGDNYTVNAGNAIFPYNHVFDVGACTTLSVFIANSTYKPVSGVLKIYGGK